MPRYVYAWTLRPASNVKIELRIRAATAMQARRELRRFLASQVSGDWSVRGIARSPAGPAPSPPRGTIRTTIRLAISARAASSAAPL